MDIIQVPRSFQLRAAPGRPIVPGTAGQKPPSGPLLFPRQRRTPGPTATTPPRSRDIEQFKSPRPGRPAISGDPAFLDRVIVPDEYLLHDMGLAEVSADSFAMAEWTQSPAGGMARSRWQKTAFDSAESRLKGMMDNVKFAQKKDSFAIVRTARSHVGDIGAIVANQNLAGRETIVRFARGKASTYVRISQSVPCPEGKN